MIQIGLLTERMIDNIIIVEISTANMVFSTTTKTNKVFRGQHPTTGNGKISATQLYCHFRLSMVVTVALHFLRSRRITAPGIGNNQSQIMLLEFRSDLLLPKILAFSALVAILIFSVVHQCRIHLGILLLSLRCMMVKI